MRAGAAFVVTTIVVVAMSSFAAVLGAASYVTGGQSQQASPSQAAIQDVPSQMLELYREAALSCPGLSWTILAGIGTVESSNGTSQLPGVHSGANYAGAEGPMQFEPGTFAEYDEPVPAGGADPPSPYDPVDSVYAAARLLCANGASQGANVQGAVFTYNHSQAYVNEVLSIASSYASSGP